MQQQHCWAPRQRYSSSRSSSIHTTSSRHSNSSSSSSSKHPRQRCAAAPQRQHTPGASTGSSIVIFYRSAWPNAKLHGSLQGATWKDFELQRVTSAPGKWLRVSIRPGRVAPGGAAGAAAPLLEFVVTDGGDGWDKPAAGGNYQITKPGTYSLRHGTVTPLPADAPPPVMLVSDLDGTMVGADDSATGAFRQWWENEAVLRGGLLVYNTGRSLDAFEKLLQEKGHCLAHPDVLLSAVGTKVYNFTPAGAWEEDVGWRKQLDEGWSVEVVRDAAYAALAEVGKDAMHFRPPEEQNDHKVTCGVSTAALGRVTGVIQQRLAAGGVAANIISSGTGDWRFLDLVPKRAGKLQALEYVRQAHGFSHAATIACGDSGNDILMLSGANLAVVVGNAQPDLLEWVQQQQTAADDSPLRGKTRLMQARQHEASGILEALDYFHYL